MRVTSACILLVLLAVAVSGCSGGPDRDEETVAPQVHSASADLRLASDPWPPFTDVQGRPRVSVDLVHGALERAGVRAETVIIDDFSEVTRQIRSGELDGSAAMWRTAEREQYMRFSRPYFENRIALVGRKGSDVSSSDLSVLRGKRVGIVKGYGYGPEVLKVSGPVFVEGPNVRSNLSSLVRGSLDYVLADELLVHHLLNQHGEKARQLLEIGGTPVARRSLHFAVRKDMRGAARIVDEFDREIRKMMADGSFNQILQIDVIEVDLDGDGRGELVMGSNGTGRGTPTRGYPLFSGGPGQPGSPGSAGFDPSALPSRYVIDGQSYNTWTEVPNRYRNNQSKESPAATLFEFDF